MCTVRFLNMNSPQKLKIRQWEKMKEQKTTVYTTIDFLKDESQKIVYKLRKNMKKSNFIIN